MCTKPWKRSVLYDSKWTSRRERLKVRETSFQRFNTEEIMERHNGLDNFYGVRQALHIIHLQLNSQQKRKVEIYNKYSRRFFTS